ncbi:MAG TPA: hypothetical protein VN950_09975 [Terriglobales bacterium]|nr:hypothetical protein [Terriglobales bacterium]
MASKRRRCDAFGLFPLNITRLSYRRHMFNRATNLSFLAFAGALLLLAWSAATAQSLRYSRVSREVVEKRLGEYAGDNKQREATLKRTFAEAGCDYQHLSEEAVKESKLPNVVCILPGTSDKCSSWALTSIAYPKATA